MKRRAIASCLSILAVVFPAMAGSAEWRVNPIRLEFGREAKSGVITVFNEKPEKLTVRMTAMEWTQDGDGKDAYSDTADLVFFPRILAFEKDGERIVRVGIRSPATAKEKTYRLFIEEVPGQNKAEGVSVAIALRIGVPIFSAPPKEVQKGEIGHVGISKGMAGALVRNTGNVHFVIQSVLVRGRNAKGEEIFSREIAGWYLLAGASRRYETEVPREVCGNLAAIEVEAKTEKFGMSGRMDADPAMCGP